MTGNKTGRGGLATVPTQNPDSHPRSYSKRSSIQAQSDGKRAEHRLLVTAWNDPCHFASTAERMGLCYEDFGDRLRMVLGQYLFDCGILGIKPSLIEIETVLRTMAVPFSCGEIHQMFITADAATDSSMADLVRDVIDAAQDRSQREFGELVRDQLQELAHVRRCRRCIACVRGLNRRSEHGSKPTVRRPVLV